MSVNVEAKREFYRRDDVAEHYDRQRYGGPGGRYVQQRENRLTASLLPARADVIADVACGTGRLFHLLSGRAEQVVGLDASLAMLGQAPRSDGSVAAVQADAFALPLRDESVEAVTCMRLLFHLQDILPLLKELRRITRPGAVLVCDTSAWSPRGLLPIGRRAWGERVWPVSSARFRASAQAAGWRVTAERKAFLITPYLYRLLPLPLARCLERLESHLPRPLLCRGFWALQAIPQAVG